MEVETPSRFCKPRSILAEEIDQRSYVKYVKTLFAYNDSETKHPDGCICGIHAGVSLPEERREEGNPICLHVEDAQQFTTPFWIALDVAKHVRDLIPTEFNFIDVGAGNGPLSAALLLAGYHGVGLERDQDTCLGKLKAFEVQNPFGGKIGYRAIYGCVTRLDDLDEIDVDFAVMNPPFKNQQMHMFFQKALSKADIVFALVPHEKLDFQSSFSKFLLRHNCGVLPLSSYDFPIRASRSWHKAEVTNIPVALVMVYKKTKEPEDPKKRWFGLNTIVEGVLEGKEPRDKEGYLNFDHAIVNEELAEKRKGNMLPTSVSLAQTPPATVNWTPNSARALVNNNISMAQKNVMWPQLAGPKMAVSEVLEYGGVMCQHFNPNCEGRDCVPFVNPHKSYIVSYGYGIHDNLVKVLCNGPLTFMDSCLPCRIPSTYGNVAAEDEAARLMTDAWKRSYSNARVVRVSSEIGSIRNEIVFPGADSTYLPAKKTYHGVIRLEDPHSGRRVKQQGKQPGPQFKGSGRRHKHLLSPGFGFCESC